MLVVVSSRVGAVALLADGALDDGYQLGYRIGFIDDAGNQIGGGEIYFGISGDNTQFFYFRMPLAYVDNTYGANAASDWGAKGHTFDNLLGSDSLGSYQRGIKKKKGKDGKKGGKKKKGKGGKKGGKKKQNTNSGSTNMGFGWTSNGTNNSVDIDYIAGVPPSTQNCIKTDKNGGCKQYASSDYRSGGVGTALADGASVKNDGAVNSGAVTDILEIATSLEWNFDRYPGYIGSMDSPVPDDSNNPYFSSAAPEWIYEVGYEIKFQADTFNVSDWLDPVKAYTLITLGNPHVSPSKKKFGSYDPDPQCIKGCVAVPEPGGTALVGLGLWFLGWYGIRNRRTAIVTAPGNG